MLNAATANDYAAQAANVPVTRASGSQKVVIVNGSPEILGLLDSVLEAGHYNVVFVESNEHAYSQVKRVRPDLVILCMHIDDMDGFQVLSMLKLDGETRTIPVLTYATEYEGPRAEEEFREPSEAEIQPVKIAELMN
jgi:CheY-like chemotaxis protein